MVEQPEPYKMPLTKWFNENILQLDQDPRVLEFEDAQFHLAHLDWEMSRLVKQQAEQEIVVQQLCELAYGHDFENGNNGAETDTCNRCGFIIDRPDYEDLHEY